MAASITWNPSLNTNLTLNSGLSKGLKVGFGTFAMDSEYATGGESLTIFNNTECVLAQPRGGYVFDYDITNSKMKALYCDNNATVAASTPTNFVEVASSADLSALSDVPFVAFGWD